MITYTILFYFPSTLIFYDDFRLEKPRSSKISEKFYFWKSPVRPRKLLHSNQFNKPVMNEVLSTLSWSHTKPISVTLNCFSGPQRFVFVHTLFFSTYMHFCSLFLNAFTAGESSCFNRRYMLVAYHLPYKQVHWIQIKIFNNSRIIWQIMYTIRKFCCKILHETNGF